VRATSGRNLTERDEGFGSEASAWNIMTKKSDGIQIEYADARKQLIII
jgi:hypothetical protein